MFIVGEQYAFHMLELHPKQGWGHSEFVATVMVVDGPRIRIDWGGKDIIINTELRHFIKAEIFTGVTDGGSFGVQRGQRQGRIKMRRASGHLPARGCSEGGLRARELGWIV